MNNKEFNSVINLAANKRYEYFIKKVVDFEEVWGLYNSGWATTIDDNNNITMIPFWPKKEFAEYCATGIWSSYFPKKIPIQEFVEKWLTGMKKDNIYPSIFWNTNDSSLVDINTLLNDISTELEKY